MEQFSYKRTEDVLALSASFTDFTYKKHCHEEYAVGVTLRGIQQYYLDGHYQASHPNGVMLFNREQLHDGSAYDKEGIDYVMLYLKPELVEEIMNCKVEHARQSLEKQKDIYAAVADCGFVDLTHLNRHFKRVFGVTAHEYTLQLQR